MRKRNPQRYMLGVCIGAALILIVSSLCITNLAPHAAAGKSQVGDAFDQPGDLDTTFNGTGMVTTDVGAFGNDLGNSVAIQADGKIVLAGQAANTPNPDVGVVRYNENGTLDTTFDGDGKVLTGIGSLTDLATAVAIQPDQKIVVAGVYQAPSLTGFVLRLNPDGSRDNTFGGGDGWSPASMNDVNAVTVQPDGKIIVAGQRSVDQQAILHRLNADGTNDTDFGNGINGPGTLYFQFDTSAGVDNNAESVIIQPDGKIIAGGCRSSGSCIYGLARFDSTGQLDTTFDGDGRVTTTGSGTVRDLALQPDGKILAFGVLTQDMNVTRYNPDGSLDATFNGTGRKNVDILGGDVARAGMVLPDGKIVMAGGAGGTNANFAAVQLNADGTLDTGFSGDGIQVVDFGSNADSGNDGALDGSGRIVIAGTSNNLFAVARLLGDGGGSGTPTPPASPTPTPSPSPSATPTPSVSPSPIPTPRTRFDFDGDGRADIAVYRPMPDPDNNFWYILQSATGTTLAEEWGLQDDLLVAADYDGDAKTDIAIWRDEPQDPDRASLYYLRSSDGTVRYVQFGRTGDDPSVTGDWDGDMIADIAVFRPGANGQGSYFYYHPSSEPGIDFVAIPWGVEFDRPARGDFDGDGMQDAAVFRPSEGMWYIRQSQNSQTRYESWGLPADRLVPADYDGDGMTDVAVLRDSMWYILQSSNGQARYETFGIATDIPVPADYDRDRKADIAVFRGGMWYLNQSTDGFLAVPYGLATDRPVSAAAAREANR